MLRLESLILELNQLKIEVDDSQTLKQDIQKSCFTHFLEV